jgi:DNA-binding transcriptional MerR regulator
MNETNGSGYLRIGELSRRTGVSPELLRAWERRYDLLDPTRSDGGFRLYSTRDESRIRSMKRHLAAGLSAAEAARLTTSEEVVVELPESTEGPLAELAGELSSALAGFDEATAERTLDQLFATYSVEAVLRLVFLPYLSEVGKRWEEGTLSIAQEHFSSQVLRMRLDRLGAGWGSGRGPTALLACPPGERHELGLMMFGVVLARQGWRISYLGPDTPLDEVEAAAGPVDVRIIVLGLTDPDSLESGALSRLASARKVFLAGPGAVDAAAHAPGARLLEGDPVEAALAISRSA